MLSSDFTVFWRNNYGFLLYYFINFYLDALVIMTFRVEVLWAFFNMFENGYRLSGSVLSKAINLASNVILSEVCCHIVFYFDSG